jgi:hypothetical protein
MMFCGEVLHDVAFLISSYNSQQSSFYSTNLLRFNDLQNQLPGITNCRVKKLSTQRDAANRIGFGISFRTENVNS